MAKLQKGVNDLKTWCLNNGDFGQQLMQEWTGECEDGLTYNIDEVARATPKRVKWKCKEGHEWVTGIVNRTEYKTQCPYCSGNRVSDKNSLKNWCLNNGDFGTRLIQEWTGECEDGKQYEIDEVAKSSAKKFKWKCSKGHEWITSVNNRTSIKSGCVQCSQKGTSYPEQFIYWSLKQIYPNTENRCRVLKSSQNPQGIEFDIGIPDIPLCIEYSPTAWHRDKQERDNYKKELCEKANVRLIQIIEDRYDELDHCIKDDYICFKMDPNKQNEILYYIVDHILKSLGHSIQEINIELTKTNALECSKGKVEYEKSLEHNYPELTKEWHPTLNKDLKPDEVVCGSGREIYWYCPVCNHGSDGEWVTTINQRTSRNSGCPKCGYNWSDGRIHKTTSTVITKGVNDLNSQYAELIKEWHQTLNNTLKPDEIKCHSGRKTYWQCTKCNYGSDGEWIRTVYQRTAQKTGCPRCGYNWSDGKIHKTHGSMLTIKGINDLQSQHPELAEEWHPTLNEDLKPDELKCGSHKKVYWQCQVCSHGSKGEWCKAVNDRVRRKSGCPRCGYNWYKAQQGLPQKYKGKYSYLNDHQTP